MRIGLDIGLKTVSIAIYEHGVPRLLSSFPSIAACQTDRTACISYFGEEAYFYRDQSSFRYIPSIQGAIALHGRSSSQIPFLPALMQNFFDYVKQLIATDGGRSVEGVALVLPLMNGMAEICELITSAWKSNGVNKVFFIPNVSAILLAYAAQTMDQQELCKTQEETVHLMVCNATSEHFQYDVFEVIANTHVAKYGNYNDTLAHCLTEIRQNLMEFVYEQLRSTGIRVIDDRDREELEKECVRQMALFNQPTQDKVTIRLLKQDRVVTVTRSQYEGIVVPHIDTIERQLVASLRKIGLMDSERKHILGFVDILLVGENSRMLPLRNVLEKLQMKPLNKSVSSYVDDAEAFGAAVASYLTGANIGMKQQLLYRLQEGRMLDMSKVLKSVLPSQESASCTVERPVKDVLVNDHPAMTVSGTLYMGYLPDAVPVTDFNLVLRTKDIRNHKFHFIQLASKGQNERVYMEMIVGNSVRMFSEDNNGSQFLLIRSFYVHGTVGCWSDMCFVTDQSDDHQRIMTDYELRFKEMLTAVPTSVQESSQPTSELVAFVALVSDQLESKKSAAACEPPHPSIVNFYRTDRGKPALLVQQCQEVVGNGIPKESSFSIEGFRCHFDNTSKALGKQDIVVIEVSSTVFVAIRFPNVDARNHFIRLSL